MTQRYAGVEGRFQEPCHQNSLARSTGIASSPGSRRAVWRGLTAVDQGEKSDRGYEDPAFHSERPFGSNSPTPGPAGLTAHASRWGLERLSLFNRHIRFDNEIACPEPWIHAVTRYGTRYVGNGQGSLIGARQASARNHGCFLSGHRRRIHPRCRGRSRYRLGTNHRMA